MFFFFKQKTAYEMRIIDWSSDVCSSDLHVPSGEVEMLDVPDRQFLAALAEIDAVAGGPGGRHRGHLVRRKLALRQDVQHFAPDLAGRPDHNSAVTHLSLLLEFANGRRFLPEARQYENLSFRSLRDPPSHRKSVTQGTR